MRHHVPAANRATEERQDAPLLERRREQASRRRAGGAEARSVFGRDQFVAGGGVAQGGRGVTPEAPGRWPCSPRIVARWCRRTTPRWCGCACPKCACIVRG